MRDTGGQLGPPQRGEETRQRLIAVALDVFGKHGFEGTSTRMLAERAGVNLAAIPYYFGGKQGLYLAVAEHLAGRLEERMGPVAKDAKEALENGISRKRARDMLQQMLDAFAAMIVGCDEAESWARFIMREQMDPTAAFDVLYGRIMGPVHAACAALVGRLLDEPSEAPETLIRTFALLGQILIFRVARAAVLRRLGWKRVHEEELRQLRAVIRQHVDAITGQRAGQ